MTLGSTTYAAQRTETAVKVVSIGSREKRLVGQVKRQADGIMGGGRGGYADHGRY
jgi:hypothetical protein